VPLHRDAEFILGCDLGQANDYTALCLVQRGATGCNVRFLSRTRGKTYPQIARDLSWLVQRPELEARTQLVVDATGVGRAVTDMLHSTRLDPVRITITSGFKAVGTRGAYKVPKQDLISGLVVALQTDRLKIASEIKHADELRHELGNFKMFSSDTGYASYEAAAGHDTS
jgi:hypothetical protein